MITVNPIPMNYLSKIGPVLLMGSAGAAVVQSLRYRKGIEPVLFTIAIAGLSLAFYPNAFSTLQTLSATFEEEIRNLGNTQLLDDMIIESLKLAANEPGPGGSQTSFNIPSIIEQVFRVGVWGVVTSIGDFFFLLSKYFIEVEKEVLLSIVQFLCPLILGFYPIIPRLAHSTAIYVLELALWGPCLALIQIMMGYIAPKYLHRQDSLGIPLIAAETVATILIMSIPKTVHHLMRGALQPTGGIGTTVGLIGSKHVTQTALSMSKGIESFSEGSSL